MSANAAELLSLLPVVLVAQVCGSAVAVAADCLSWKWRRHPKAVAQALLLLMMVMTVAGSSMAGLLLLLLVPPCLGLLLLASAVQRKQYAVSYAQAAAGQLLFTTCWLALSVIAILVLLFTSNLMMGLENLAFLIFVLSGFLTFLLLSFARPALLRLWGNIRARHLFSMSGALPVHDERKSAD